MGRLARQLDADRAVRNAARSAFDTRLARIRQDLDARGVGGRIADRIGDDARDVIDEAVEVADNNTAIIAGTIGALALWLFRRPLLAWAQHWFESDDEEVEDGKD